MLRDVRFSVLAERGGEVAAFQKHIKTGFEFVVIAVIEAAVAPHAMAFHDRAMRRRQDRRADAPRFERDNREALHLRRHQQRVRRRHAIDFVLVRDEAEHPNIRPLRQRHDRFAHQNQAEIALMRGLVAREEVNHLAAAFALVNPPRINNKIAGDAEFLPKRLRLRLARNVHARAQNFVRNVLIVKERVRELLFLNG